MTREEAKLIAESYMHLKQMKCAKKHSSVRHDCFVVAIDYIRATVNHEDYEIRVILKAIDGKQTFTEELSHFLVVYTQTY